MKFKNVIGNKGAVNCAVCLNAAYNDKGEFKGCAYGPNCHYEVDPQFNLIEEDYINLLCFKNSFRTKLFIFGRPAGLIKSLSVSFDTLNQRPILKFSVIGAKIVWVSPGQQEVLYELPSSLREDLAKTGSLFVWGNMQEGNYFKIVTDGSSKNSKLYLQNKYIPLVKSVSWRIDSYIEEDDYCSSDIEIWGTGMNVEWISDKDILQKRSSEILETSKKWDSIDFEETIEDE